MNIIGIKQALEGAPALIHGSSSSGSGGAKATRATAADARIKTLAARITQLRGRLVTTLVMAARTKR